MMLFASQKLARRSNFCLGFMHDEEKGKKEILCIRRMIRASGTSFAYLIDGLITIRSQQKWAKSTEFHEALRTALRPHLLSNEARRIS